MSRLLKLGLLAGAGYFAYKKLTGNKAHSLEGSSDPWGEAQHRNENSLREQITRTVNQAINAAKEGRSRFRMSSSGSEAESGGSTSGQPREAQAARMAAQPAPPPAGEFGAPVTAPPAAR